MSSAEAMRRVERIRELEADADHLEADASARRWEAARLIDEELQGGKSARQLGREIEKSHTHVRKMAAVWRHWGGNQVSTSFNQLYRATQVNRTEAETHPRMQYGHVAGAAVGPTEPAQDLLGAVDTFLDWARDPETDRLMLKALLPSVRGAGRRLITATEGNIEAPWRPVATLYKVNSDGTREAVPFGRRRKAAS